MALWLGEGGPGHPWAGLTPLGATAFASAGMPSRSAAGAKAGAPGRTRTNTTLRPTDFESAASTISPLGRRGEAVATGGGGRKAAGVGNPRRRVADGLE